MLEITKGKRQEIFSLENQRRTKTGEVELTATTQRIRTPWTGHVEPKENELSRGRF